MKCIIDIPVEWCGDHGVLRVPYKVQNAVHWFNTGIDMEPYDESGRSEDGWNLARAIRKMDDPDIEEAFSVSGWTRPIDGVLEMIEYAEAKAKYDAWQKQKEKDEIHVGDEVRSKDKPEDVMVVTGTDEPGYASVIKLNGRAVLRVMNNIEKTGRSFPEVAELLEKMKEKAPEIVGKVEE